MPSIVGASISDASDHLIAQGTKQGYDRSELTLEGAGTGNPPYKIRSGHYAFLCYSVNNYYDPYTHSYRNGYLDYWYYTYYSEGPGYPTFDIPVYFDFIGRRPETVTPSINRFLGTLLAEFLNPSADRIRYKTAKVDSTTRNFDGSNNAELPLNETSGGSNYCYGSASNPVTLVLDFELPEYTSDVFMDSRSFMNEDETKDQFSQMSGLQFSNMNLSTVPKTGRVSVSMFRKRPSSNFPNNKVRITVAGRISGGGSFSTTGRVKLTCP